MCYRCGAQYRGVGGDGRPRAIQSGDAREVSPARRTAAAGQRTDPCHAVRCRRCQRSVRRRRWTPNSFASKKTCAGRSTATSTATICSCRCTPATRASSRCRRWAWCGRARATTWSAIVRYAAERGIPLYRPRRRHGAGRRFAGPRAGHRLLAALPPHSGDRRRLGDRAAGRRARAAQRPAAQGRPHVRPRPGRRAGHDDRQRRRARRLGQPLAGVRLGAAARARAGGRAGRRADRAAVAACAAGRRRSRARRTRRRIWPPACTRSSTASPRRHRAAARRAAWSTAAATICTICARDDGIDLARLLVGSEGTLALVTEATLGTVPLPQHIGVRAAVLHVAGQRGARPRPSCRRSPLRACDLMDRRHLSLAREMDPRYEFLIPAEAEAVLLVEREARLGRGRARRDPAKSRTLVVDRLKLASGVARGARRRRPASWCGSSRGGSCRRCTGCAARRGRCRSSRTSPCRRRSCRRFCSGRSRRCARGRSRRRSSATRRTGSCTFGRSSTWPTTHDVQKLRDLAEELYEARVGGRRHDQRRACRGVQPHAVRRAAARAADGGVSRGEAAVRPAGHSESRQEDSARRRSPPTAPLRRITYPLLGSARRRTAPTRRRGRRQVAGADGPLIPLQLAWRPAEMTYAARMCNGCGACRTQSAGHADVPDLPPVAARGGLAAGEGESRARHCSPARCRRAPCVDDAFKEIVDLCVHCHMCRLECPANVDIPKLMAEAKAAYVATNGLRLSRLGADADRLPVRATASRAPRLANWAIGNRVGAVADGEDARHRPGPQAAAVQQAAVLAVADAAAARPAAPRRRREGAAVRRHLRQLLRRAARRGAGRRAGAQRHLGLRARAAARSRACR